LALSALQLKMQVQTVA